MKKVWIWVIVAVIVIAGIVFAVKVSTNKDTAKVQSNNVVSTDVDDEMPEVTDKKYVDPLDSGFSVDPVNQQLLTPEKE